MVELVNKSRGFCAEQFNTSVDVLVLLGSQAGASVSLPLCVYI